MSRALCSAGKRALLDCKVGVEVDLRGVDFFVSKPERDDSGVDASMKQLHGGGVLSVCAVTFLADSDGQVAADFLA